MSSGNLNSNSQSQILTDRNCSKTGSTQSKGGKSLLIKVRSVSVMAKQGSAGQNKVTVIPSEQQQAPSMQLTGQASTKKVPDVTSAESRLLFNPQKISQAAFVAALEEKERLSFQVFDDAHAKSTLSGLVEQCRVLMENELNQQFEKNLELVNKATLKDLLKKL